MGKMRYLCGHVGLFVPQTQLWLQSQVIGSQKGNLPLWYSQPSEGGQVWGQEQAQVD